MNAPAKIFVRNGKLIVELPLTNPTGKIRVKRLGEKSNYGLPVATRKESFTKYDLLKTLQENPKFVVLLLMITKWVLS
ncbi:MAG: hypothetical protein ABIL49_02860 [candidate division WOR-3 bacterium]|jgi:hypothetical protein